jgi:hypothetical protein
VLKEKKMGFRKSKAVVPERKPLGVASRATFWAFWIIASAVTSAYAALSLIVFVQLTRTHNTNGFPDSARRQLRAPQIAAFYGAAVAVLTNVIAFLILLWSTTKCRGAGFWYGYLVAAYGIGGCLFLLCGIVMWAGNTYSTWELTGHWNSKLSAVYTAAYLLAWISAGIYLATWTCLFFFYRTVSKRRPGHIDEETAGYGAIPPPVTAYDGKAAKGNRGWFGRHKHEAAAPMATGPLTAGATGVATAVPHQPGTVTGVSPAHATAAPVNAPTGVTTPATVSGVPMPAAGTHTPAATAAPTTVGPLTAGAAGTGAALNPAAAEGNKAGFFMGNKQAGNTVV